MQDDETTARAPTSDPTPARTSGRPTLRRLFQTNRRRILTTYLLFNVENALRLAQPLVLGLAINGLLQASYGGVLLFVVQHLAHLLVGSFRQMYDTRVFSAIYTDLAG